MYYIYVNDPENIRLEKTIIYKLEKSVLKYVEPILESIEIKLAISGNVESIRRILHKADNEPGGWFLSTHKDISELQKSIVPPARLCRLILKSLVDYIN